MCEITHAVCIASEVKFSSTIEMCQWCVPSQLKYTGVYKASKKISNEINWM